MPEIRASKIELMLDGRRVEVKNERKGNFELNAALRDPDGFRAFAEDPAAFAADHGLELDSEISAKLSEKLQSFDSLADLKLFLAEIGGGGLPVASALSNSVVIAHSQATVSGYNGATVWAVASGAYSVATSKVAVAF